MQDLQHAKIKRQWESYVELNTALLLLSQVSHNEAKQREPHKAATGSTGNIRILLPQDRLFKGEFLHFSYCMGNVEPQPEPLSPGAQVKAIHLCDQKGWSLAVPLLEKLSPANLEYFDMGEQSFSLPS